MEKKLGVGQLSCKVCGQHFQTGINCTSTHFTPLPKPRARRLEDDGSIKDSIADTASDLSAPVDVYSEWIDACDAVAKDAAGATRMTGAPPMQKLDKIRQDGHEGSTGEMDDFIEVDEADAEGEFAEE